MQKLNGFPENGFGTIADVYTKEEIENILSEIKSADKQRSTFRVSSDLFAIRQFLKEIPAAANIIFNDKLKGILDQIFGDKYCVVKSIYFDKPPASNWYVAYHQDLTISVDKKIDVEGFNCWTIKQGQFAVQPPLEFLENIVTIRIHLDETDEHNGALKVIPGSHLKAVFRSEKNELQLGNEVTCNVSEGGVMLMKPLLMHSSGRTTNGKQRRVIHIEFSNMELPEELKWAERLDVN